MLTRDLAKVQRKEHDDVFNALRHVRQHTSDVERHTHDLEVQFKRIAQIQSDLDEVKRAWDKVKVV